MSGPCPAVRWVSERKSLPTQPGYRWCSVRSPLDWQTHCTGLCFPPYTAVEFSGTEESSLPLWFLFCPPGLLFSLCQFPTPSPPCSALYLFNLSSYPVFPPYICHLPLGSPWPTAAMVSPLWAHKMLHILVEVILCGVITPTRKRFA